MNYLMIFLFLTLKINCAIVKIKKPKINKNIYVSSKLADDIKKYLIAIIEKNDIRIIEIIEDIFLSLISYKKMFVPNITTSPFRKNNVL